MCAGCHHKTRDKVRANKTSLARRLRLTGAARQAYLDAKRADGKRRHERARIAKGGATKVQIMARAVERRQAAQEAKVAAAIARQVARAEKIKSMPWLDPALTPAQRWQVRYDNDPVFNMQERFRAHIKRGRFGKWAKLGCRLRDAMVKDRLVHPEYAPLIDYTAQDLAAHLQRQFTKRMSWAKFCAGLIHIDHRIPLASFDMTDEAQARAAWALTNLQPLWAPDNQSKHARRTVLL